MTIKKAKKDAKAKKSRTKKSTTKKTKVRNPHALPAKTRKAGAHKDTRATKRRKMEKDDEAREILEDALKLLEKDGWWSPHLEFGEGAGTKICAVEAIVYTIPLDQFRVVGMNAVEFRAKNALRTSIGRHSIAAWNDARGRTFPQVRKAFKEAIALVS